MLSLNSRQPSSTSMNCGRVPLEKQGKERRKEVGLEKTHKPSLLLLLPLPDGIRISKLIALKIQFKPSLLSANPKPSLQLPDRIRYWSWNYRSCWHQTRLKSRLTANNRMRTLIIETILLLSNFRTSHVGLNQIATVFNPHYDQYVNVDGYDRIARYFANEHDF